jgi:hypothetical protein
VFAVFHDGFDVAAKVLVLAALLGVGKIVVIGFLPEFEVAVVSVLSDNSSLDGFKYGASGLPGVCATRKAASRGQVAEIRKVLLEPVPNAEEPEFAHSRSVDQHGAVLQNKQLAPRRGVCAFAGRTDRSGRQRLLVQQAIDQCAFSHPG